MSRVLVDLVSDALGHAVAVDDDEGDTLESAPGETLRSPHVAQVESERRWTLPSSGAASVSIGSIRCS